MADSLSKPPNGTGPESDGRPLSRVQAIQQALNEPGTLQRILCAALAWSVTVAPAAFSRAGSAPSRATAVLALAAAVSGPAIATRIRRIGRHIGISLFLVFSLATWLMSPAAIDPSRIDSIRAALGAMAWGVYAFSWGEPWTGLGGAAAPGAQVDPFAAPLRARATLAPLAVPIATFGVVTTLMLLAGVWQIHETSRALIAQAGGVAIAVGLVSVGATVAVSRGKERPKNEKRMTPGVVRALVLLAAAAVLGAVILALRG